jgi:hypothetical protein
MSPFCLRMSACRVSVPVVVSDQLVKRFERIQPYEEPWQLKQDALMRIWKLTPTDLSNPIWKIWTPEPIIVRAENAAEARHLAKLETLKFLPAIPHQPFTDNPWGGYKKIGDRAPPIGCEDITEQTAEYSVDGAAAVLRHGERY